MKLVSWYFGLEDKAVCIKTEIANSGDRDIFNVRVKIRYFDEGGYLIKESIVTIKGDIPAKTTMKFKTLLSEESYPYWQKTKEATMQLFSINELDLIRFIPDQ